MFGYPPIDKQSRAFRSKRKEAKIRAMATVQGADLDEVIVDGGESAKSLNRPGLQRLLALINSGDVECVIVAKLDRLTRSVKDLCGLLELFEKRKVALISVAETLDTGSAAGRLVITIMAAVSQWEREAIGERTRDALSHKRGKGERVGNIEFGYKLGADGVHLEADSSEQAALAMIRQLRASGRSFRAIASALNQSGHRTRRNSPSWRTFVGVSGARGSWLLEERRATLSSDVTGPSRH